MGYNKAIMRKAGKNVLDKVRSAGGVVFYKDRILMLRKRSGDWVLPKGHIEEGEDAETAAKREVFEEGGVEAKPLSYLGEIDYSFPNRYDARDIVYKNVAWYYMKADSDYTKPQIEEGFVKSDFIEMDMALEVAKYSDEKRMIEKAIARFRSLERDYTKV